MRKGRISKEEERTIAKLLDSLTPEDIAVKLDRDIESVIDFIKRKFRVGVTKEEAAAFSLEDRPDIPHEGYTSFETAFIKMSSRVARL